MALPVLQWTSSCGPRGCRPSLLSVLVGRGLSLSVPALELVEVWLSHPRRVSARRDGPGITPPNLEVWSGIWLPCHCHIFPSHGSTTPDGPLAAMEPEPSGKCWLCPAQPLHPLLELPGVPSAWRDLRVVCCGWHSCLGLSSW